MRNIYSPNEMKEIDSLTIKNNNFNEFDLVNIASKAIFLKIKNELTKKLSILVISGPGLNGCDGIVLAHFLINNGYNVKIFIPVLSEKINKIIDLYNLNYIENTDYNYDVIIDAIFGISYQYKENSVFNKIIDDINLSKCKVYSIDFPSGINPLNGSKIKAIKAYKTFVIGAFKTGNLLDFSRDYEGIIEFIDINLLKYDNKTYLLDDSYFNNFISKRFINTNKGNYKRSSLIAGSKSYMGASILALQALSSIRLGCGYSSLCIPSSLYQIYALRYPEITLNLLKDKDGYILYDEEELDNIMKTSATITIGMGITKSIDSYKIICYLLRKFDGILVIDADGLNSISEYGIDCLKNKKANVILTPHLKEASRLLKISVDELKENRLELAKEFAKKYNLILVLKDSTTIITNGNQSFFNITGNPGLSKGGSGDILAGLITGAILGLKKNMLDGTLAATYILGTAADLLCQTMPCECILGSDIINVIPEVIKKFK